MEYDLIDNLTLNQKKFFICGVVSYVGPIQTSKKNAKYFTMVISDKTNDIKVNVPPEHASKYNQIAPYKMVQLKNGLIRLTPPMYKALNTNFEIALNATSELSIIRDTKKEGPSILTSRLSKIAEIIDVVAGGYVDILAYVKEVGLHTQYVNISTNRGRKEVLLIDDSGASINCVFWGSRCDEIGPEKNNQIVFLRNVKVTDYDKKTLSATSTTYMEINPRSLNDLVNPLKKFIDSSGTTVGQQLSVPLSGLKELNNVNEIINVDANGQKEFIVRVTVTTYENTPYYACSNPKCPPVKLMDDENNNKTCKMCNGTDTKECPVLSLKIEDSTGKIYVSCFDPFATQLVSHLLNKQDEFYFKVRITLSKKSSQLNYLVSQFELCEGTDSRPLSTKSIQIQSPQEAQALIEDAIVNNTNKQAPLLPYTKPPKRRSAAYGN